MSSHEADESAFASHVSIHSPCGKVLFSISKLLNTGLDRETLQILFKLCESGVDPEALAHVVEQLRQESNATSVENTNSSR